MMLFEGKSLFEIRHPVMEEDYLPVLRLCAVLDCTQQVGALANAFRIRELSIDLAVPDDDIITHCKKHRPDILLLNCDVLPAEYIADLAKGLDAAAPALLITIGSNETKAKTAGSYFKNHLNLAPPVYPPRDAEYLEKLFLTRVISRDYYIGKLRLLVEITLSAMHCKNSAAGSEYLKFAVTQVLCEPYRYFGSSQAVSRMIAAEYNVTPANVNSVLTNTISKAVHSMTKAEFNAAFDRNGSDETPSNIEFIYAAARLASRPAKRILSNLNDEPFEYPQRKIKMI